MASETHTAWTPGPWNSVEGAVSGRDVIAPNAPKTRRRIAACGGQDRNANALLIAAAPDLAEAAAEVLSFRVDTPTRGDLRDNDASRAALHKLADALARATTRPSS